VLLEVFYMSEGNIVLSRMNDLLDTWEAAHDRRLIFLRCYELMTQNVQNAIDTNDFEDVMWVDTLMKNFANYYFIALEAYDREQADSPDPWRIAFKAANNPHIHVLQNLVLGVNAHINYDLVFALSDILAPEWQQLTAEQRKMRYRDHNHVNDIIYHTINAVQDEVVDRYDPRFAVVDKVLGPVDEWMTKWLISEWREEVWEHATLLIETQLETERQAITQHVKKESIKRAEDILGEGGLSALVDFI
jgi:hypothetical protein